MDFAISKSHVVSLAALFIYVSLVSCNDRVPKADLSYGNEALEVDATTDGPAGWILSDNLSTDETIRRTGVPSDTLESLSFILPEIKRKDQFEKTSDFNTRSENEWNAWRQELITPDSHFLIVSESPEFAEYDADSGKMTVSQSVAPVSISPFGDAGVRSQSNGPVESVSSSDVYFVNVGRALDTNIDGYCSLKYTGRSSSQKISFKIDADNARSIINKLKMYYIVQFKAPSYSKSNEWCYRSIESNDPSIYDKNNDGQFISRSNHHINVQLLRMIVSDGMFVYWEKSFSPS